MPFNVLSVSSILYLTRLKSEKNVDGPPAGTSPDIILGRPRTFFGDVRRLNVTKWLQTFVEVKIWGDVVIIHIFL